MSNHVGAALVTAAAISLFLTPPSSAKSQKCTTTRKATQHAATTTHRQATHRRHSGGHVTGLVPPPPAYMPCVLPELYYRGATTNGVTEITTEEKKENPYSQYVKNTNGDSPEAMSSRKGVVTWNNRR